MQEIYENKDGKCECCKCEKRIKCPFADKYQRHDPKDAPGALALCPKLKK